ncbi:Precorrin-6Y C(5,15)-methyltransferase [decarboxylating] [Sulfitobacter sp. THAF37]|uniref:precorrin-6y C5,15-methyltransferase (decarboxylating) subunit CbiE n=1 Tax=Sulfitobacter sp. THAF37 TaxID=2587855 RepID=UPI0012682143|nr:precorrin-6y C5,15-methyltransferase (decarboxylating) subunit CbiE [Sulfitobacter sp. THAF37]QFT58407.1 Precorrin-6Y C(5,15)-methyltransferase [decarboxylating] [Sulfitobacter sp. THAF37]
MGDPWLSIVGMPHDTAAHLSPASQAAIDAAEVIFGGPRHLELMGAGARGQAWPVPFTVEPVLNARGRRVVVLASGDPFWFGAGGSLSVHLDPGEWRVLPTASTFSLVAGTLGWRLEDVTCHGLHAAPIGQLRGALAPHARLICLMRDGAAPSELAQWLTDQGAGAAQLIVCERMGGPEQRIRQGTAGDFSLSDVAAPVAVAVALPENVGLPRSAGLPDDLFANDGQITKRPVRALTLSALGPRPGEVLWDIGAGSGSVSVEWCLAGGQAEAFEQHAERVANIVTNADRFGVSHRLTVRHGDAAALIADRAAPDAVFVGGGGSDALFDALLETLPKGTRLVANGVTLETEARLARLQAEKGGSLLRVELAEATPLGRMRGWQPLRPVVQWSVTL